MAAGELSDISSAEVQAFVPEGVVPFTIAEPDARGRAERWIRRTWFAPSMLVRRAREDGIAQRFLPYWLFDARAIGYWSAAGVTRGIIEMDFLHMLVSAERAAFDDRSELDPALVNAIRAYSLREIGLTEVAEPQRAFDEAAALAHARMEAELAGAAKRSRPPKERDKLNLSRVEYARESCRRLLLPMWQLDYRYLGRRYRIAIDGATGRVVGEAPKSVVKTALVAAIVLWLALLVGDADTALSIPQRMADGFRWLMRRTLSS
jgi:hypothetical protein